MHDDILQLFDYQDLFDYFKSDLVVTARDPLWEESWGSGKMQKRTSL